MTVPKWIEEALTEATSFPDGEVDAALLTAALIDRLPLERMIRAAAFGPYVDTDVPTVLRMEAARRIVCAAVAEMADGDADTVILTALYQDACRALDVAGVPYANADEVPVPLDLTARIRWLAMQRPTRLDLQRVEAEKDEARDDVAKLQSQRDELAKHVKASPLGWVDGKVMLHRSTTDPEIVTWLQRLDELVTGAG